ncbi:MAG: AmmeMemoRadiSam system protein B [Thermoplasmata archaeon]|nr:AmmeMemoRadiSam system protein B [Thermoplasmata archaeon]
MTGQLPPRPPAVAGRFYAGDGADLAREIEQCFVDPRGPGSLPVRHRSPERHIRAAVVPHAGLAYSGAIAAHAYAAIAAERPPGSVLILGVNHAGEGAPAALSDRAWMTPLGPVQTDHALVNALARRPITVDEATHLPEHSIEVQLPFVDYVLPHPRFVALMVRYGDFEFLEEVGRIVAEAVRDRDVLLIASTDFSHYIPPARAEALDRRAIDRILELDARGLYDTVLKDDISMCGVAPTTSLLAAIGGEGLTARLLRWGHSGEVEPMSTVVGYASLLLESKQPLA